MPEFTPGDPRWAQPILSVCFEGNEKDQNRYRDNQYLNPRERVSNASFSSAEQKIDRDRFLIIFIFLSSSTNERNTLISLWSVIGLLRNMNLEFFLGLTSESFCSAQNLCLLHPHPIVVVRVLQNQGGLRIGVHITRNRLSLWCLSYWDHVNRHCGFEEKRQLFRQLLGQLLFWIILPGSFDTIQNLLWVRILPIISKYLQLWWTWTWFSVRHDIIKLL